jgi:hypothetical protein
MEYLTFAAGYIVIFGIGMLIGCALYCVFDFLRFIYDILFDLFTIFLRELRRPN